MPNKINNQIEQEVIISYNNGYGVMELTEKYGLHRTTIQRVLKRNGVKLRKRTPTHYNIHFFDEYNEASCYWAGFIAADGYVRSDRSAVTIHLASTDYEHLLKLAQLTDYEGNVNINNNECYITFSGKWFQEALADKFDIYSIKTFDVEISEKIPKDMVKHFIRGYFDGDGSVTHTGEYLRINFTSGSKILLNQIINYIYECGIRVRNQTHKPPICKYTVNYNCINAFKVLNILYNESSDQNRLDRKYQLYLNEKRIYEDIPIFTQNKDYVNRLVMV